MLPPRGEDVRGGVAPWRDVPQDAQNLAPGTASVPQEEQDVAKRLPHPGQNLKVGSSWVEHSGQLCIGPPKPGNGQSLDSRGLAGQAFGL